MKIFNLLYYFLMISYCADSSAKNTDLIINQKEIIRFIEALKIIKKNYIREIDDEKAISDAINGTLSGLDHHSVYYTKEEYIDTIDKTNGLYGGLGIEVSIINGNLQIIKVNKNSVAENSGIKEGDTIIEIDNKKVKGLTMSDIKSLIRGEMNTVVTLKVFRDFGKEGSRIVDMTLTRTMIKVESLESEYFLNNVLYLKINRFSENLFDDMNEQIKNSKDIKGIILDLRNNGGGLLEQAIKISDAFLSSGEIVSVKSGDFENNVKKYNASGLNLFSTKIPLIVLINNYSASASEVVAGALRDNKRAILVGKKTFGKGSVQNIIALKDGDAIKITTALFYRPNGKIIQQQGIEPDIEVDDMMISGVKSDFCPIKSERDLEKINNQDVTEDDYNKLDNKPDNVKIDSDLQLYVAKQVMNYQMNLLRK